MTEDVIFKGYSANPADRVCEDGTLSTCMNLVPENGALFPVDNPKVLFKLPEGYKILCIHKIGTISNYIFSNNIGWLSYAPCPIESQDELNSSIKDLVPLFDVNIGDIHKVTPIGATLCVNAENGVFYVKWDAGSGYRFLGNEIPFPEIQFSCHAQVAHGDVFEVPMDYIYDVRNGINEKDRKNVTDAVFGAVNKFIAENATGKGKFCMPFFVRYAVRLYDGSLTMHSAPVLMLGHKSRGPYVRLQVAGEKQAEFTHEHSYSAHVFGPVARLRAILKNNFADKMKEWKDIVKSVDIFVSQPIYSIDINKEISKFKKTKDIDDEVLCALDSAGYNTDDKYNNISDIVNFSNLTLRDDLLSADAVDVPIKEEYLKQYDSESRFYLFKSLEIGEYGELKFDMLTFRNFVGDTIIVGGFINVADDYLQSLAEREVMTDDFYNHNRIYAKDSFEYNSRLNLCGIKRRLWDGMYGGIFLQNYPGTTSDRINCIAYFHISKDGKNYIVNSREFYHCNDYKYDYIFFPDTGCTKITIYSTTTGKCLVIPMKQHEFINGAYSFTTEKREWVDDDVPQVSDDLFVDYGNRVFTSEVNNPFLFKVDNIYSIGNGNVLSMCSASKAMSQGQFGQYPLYCFTDEGVWALEVSQSTGAFSSRHPVTRDVVRSPESILQLDSEVAFCTDRGIMLLSGSQSQCITDVLDSREVFSPTQLPKFKEFIGGFNSDEVSKFLSLTYLRFEEYVKTASMIYDYSHQRIVVFNTREDIPYAYVFSIKEKAWGMMMLDAASTVNSYPASLFCDNAGNVYDMAVTSDDGDDTLCLIVTRPIKLGYPDVFKRVRMLINRTVTRARNNVSQVLYGSNDLSHWHIVTSSNNDRMGVVSGSPYKYFVLMALYRLEYDNYVSGVSIDYNHTLTNRLR